uniref:Uncharacterized protein n=1 Tax=Fagus sylvatica TaxID=28930 RepID=A0A2N9F4M1_FAGSY
MGHGSFRWNSRYESLALSGGTPDGSRLFPVREICPFASFLGSRWVTACDLQIGDREISRPARGGGVVRGEVGSGWLGKQRVREQRVRGQW